MTEPPLAPAPVPGAAGQPDGEDLAPAQRPRLVNRLRLIPLGLLVLCVGAAAVAGLVRNTPVTAGAPASAASPAAGGHSGTKAAARAARQQAAKAAKAAKNSCTPPFHDGVTREPWQGKQRVQSEKTYQAQIKQENPAYVKGKGDWYFFTDYQAENFSQAVGRITQTAKQQAAWVRFIKKSAAIVKKGGGDYRVVVAPANWDVYPQKLPTWAQKLRGTTSLENLLKDHPELPWIDTRAALAKAAKKHDTYEGHDSHWTPYGGYVAWQAITNCLRATDPALGPIDAPAISGVGIEKNNNEFVANGVPDGKPARTYPLFAQPHPAVTMTHLPDGAAIANSPDFSTDTLQTPLKTETTGAQAPGVTMLTLRDSTGNALSPLYSWSFGTTIQYAHGIGQTEKPPNLRQLVSTYHPNVVLFVITERFLSYPPPQ